MITDKELIGVMLLTIVTFIGLLFVMNDAMAFVSSGMACLFYVFCAIMFAPEQVQE